jgi:uncharacterized YigZ family protein
VNDPDTYKTIETRAKGSYRDRGSRFFAFACPVSNKEEIRSVLDELRKEYHDARHHCYAYMLGADADDYRANDDGEPAGSAGQPILGQIRSKGLSNVLVVVVRYFGGTLLGVGGLIKAYRTAAADALQNARVITAEESLPVRILYPYELTREIMRITADEKARITGQEYTDVCRMEIQLRKSRTGELLKRINKLPGAKAELA